MAGEPPPAGHRLPLWSSDIDALIALDHLDQAQPVADDLLRRASASRSPHAVAIAKRCEGLLLAARGQFASAIDALDLALVEHGRQRLPLELGRTLLEKGSLERRAKRKTAAKQTLEQALAVLEPLGAALQILEIVQGGPGLRIRSHWPTPVGHPATG